MKLINYWLTRKDRNRVTEEINKKLIKYVGRPIQPTLWESMRKTVLHYFKKHPQELKFFLEENGIIDYDVETEQVNGIVTKAYLKTK